MMCRVFFVVLVLALLYCCSCVFAVEEEEEEPQVTQVNAVCAGDGNVARWQLRGKPLWYNCTDAATGVGQMICGMGVGNCASEASQSRTKGVAKDSVFTINVTSPTPEILESWWKRNVEKDVTVASVPAKPPEAGPPSPREHKDSLDASSRPDSDSSAGAEGAAGSPSPPPPATPGSAGANSAAVAAATTDSSSSAASQASGSAPSGDSQGHSRSPSPAPESPPDPEPTEGGGHSSH
ncbi:hypothetical protein TCSYLVIO_009562, partial [Trypanosoma cruzi]